MEIAERRPEPLLKVRDAAIHLRVHGTTVKAVDGVSVDVGAGECVGIVGESGSGKSTLGRMVSRLMPNVEIAKIAGTVSFDGIDVLSMNSGELRALRSSAGISMVFQDPLYYLNPTMRIERQLAEALAFLKDRSAIARRSEELLLQVGLKDTARILRQYPHELSGGMRQRVMIAMALAPSPRLLIADEPTTALDATVQYRIIQLLRQLNATNKLAMVIITHDLGMIAELCDYVYVMKGGQVVESADVYTIFEAPQHPYTQELLTAARSLNQTQSAAPVMDVSA